jgi:hypothetical protein
MFVLISDLPMYNFKLLLIMSASGLLLASAFISLDPLSSRLKNPIYYTVKSRNESEPKTSWSFLAGPWLFNDVPTELGLCASLLEITQISRLSSGKQCYSKHSSAKCIQ